MPKRITVKEIDKGSISSSIKDGGEKLVTAGLLKDSIVKTFDEGDDNSFASSKLTKELKKEIDIMKEEGTGGGIVIIPEDEEIAITDRKAGNLYLKVTKRIAEVATLYKVVTSNVEDGDDLQDEVGLQAKVEN